MGRVVGAVECEVAQRGELGFDPEPKYRWTGYAMIAVGLAGIAAGAGGVVLAGAVAGFGCAATLWATGAAVLKRG